jgi:hypothetical protein
MARYCNRPGTWLDFLEDTVERPVKWRRAKGKIRIYYHPEEAKRLVERGTLAAKELGDASGGIYGDGKRRFLWTTSSAVRRQLESARRKYRSDPAFAERVDLYTRLLRGLHDPEWGTKPSPEVQAALEERRAHMAAKRALPCAPASAGR